LIFKLAFKKNESYDDISNEKISIQCKIFSLCCNNGIISVIDELFRTIKVSEQKCSTCQKIIYTFSYHCFYDCQRPNFLEVYSSFECETEEDTKIFCTKCQQ